MFFSLCRVFNRRMFAAIGMITYLKQSHGSRKIKNRSKIAFWSVCFIVEVPGRFEPPYAVLQTAT